MLLLRTALEHVQPTTKGMFADSERVPSPRGADHRNGNIKFTKKLINFSIFLNHDQQAQQEKRERKNKKRRKKRPKTEPYFCQRHIL
jgi:hypothetical protein